MFERNKYNANFYEEGNRESINQSNLDYARKHPNATKLENENDYPDSESLEEFADEIAKIKANRNNPKNLK